MLCAQLNHIDSDKPRRHQDMFYQNRQAWKDSPKDLEKGLKNFLQNSGRCEEHLSAAHIAELTVSACSTGNCQVVPNFQ